MQYMQYIIADSVCANKFHFNLNINTLKQQISANN